MTHVHSVNDVLISFEPLLNGWGRLGEVRRWTPKAGLFDYHGRDLWIAKTNCMSYGGDYYAKVFAIKAAQEWAHDNPRKS